MPSALTAMAKGLRIVSAPAFGDLRQVAEDAFAEALAGRDHVVGAGRRPADAQHGIALADQLARHRMEDLVEYGVAGLLRAGMLQQRQGEPLAQHWQMAVPE